MAAAAEASDTGEKQSTGQGACHVPAKGGQEIPTGADAGIAAKGTSNESVEVSPSESNHGGNITPLSAQAPVFVPSGSNAPADGVEDESDVRAKLPPNHRTMLRQGYHTATGEWVAYHVGRLKSYNSRTGYGFITCAQSFANHGADVFIHKNSMMNPWNIGQPVEFAVIVNARGQPQATDVNWLPQSPAMPQSSGVTSTMLPHSRNDKTPSLEGGQDGGSTVNTTAGVPHVSNRTAAAGAAMGADAAAGGTQTQAANPAASQPAFRSADVGETRRLGTLKSFSPAQGYGFVACEEVFSKYQRDAYFDKSQLPSSNWHFGQTVEFAVAHNARGHPQARQIDWDPVPNLQQASESGAAGVLSGTTTSASGGSNPRLHSSQTLSNLKSLLQHLQESQPEKAVVQAINLQGGSNATGGASTADVDNDTDYVTFVLDRLGREADAVPKIKDFVKMLLLLMLAKMLRSQINPSRCQQHIRWFEALSLTIEPAAESVRDHFHSVVEQINNQLQSAHRDNTVLSEDAQLPVLQAAFRRLQDKCVAV